MPGIMGPFGPIMPLGPMEWPMPPIGPLGPMDMGPCGPMPPMCGPDMQLRGAILLGIETMGLGFIPCMFGGKFMPWELGGGSLEVNK